MQVKTQKNMKRSYVKKKMPENGFDWSQKMEMVAVM